MQPDIVEFWKRCPLDGPPFVHPDDREEISRRAPGALDELIKSYEGFVQSQRFGDFDDYAFHLSLLPAPYLGDLNRARIFLLLLNPGFDMADYYAEYQVPAFRQRAAASLNQRFDGVEFPFLFLDPEFSWHGGFGYFERKLRSITQKVARQAGVTYLDGLRQLARSLAVLQMVPYHSAAFRDNWALKLPSAAKARQFACEQIYPRAKAGEAIAVILRNGKQWDAPECPSIVSYTGPLARGASLGAETPGGKTILKFLGFTDP